MDVITDDVTGRPSTWRQKHQPSISDRRAFSLHMHIFRNSLFFRSHAFAQPVDHRFIPRKPLKQDSAGHSQVLVVPHCIWLDQALENTAHYYCVQTTTGFQIERPLRTCNSKSEE